MATKTGRINQNRTLTGVAIQFIPPELQWRKIMKRMPVGLESGDYYKYDRDLFLAPPDDRANGGESNETEMGWRLEPFQCTQHALKGKITDRDRKNADDEFDLESQTTELVKGQVENRIEYATFGRDGILRTVANNIGSDNLDWTNIDTASPRTGIQKAISAVQIACGFKPNTICAASDILRHLTSTLEWKDENRYDHSLSQSDNVPSMLYGLDVVEAASQVVPYNVRGQSKVATELLMGDDVWIGYVHPGETLPQKAVSFGGTLMNEEYTSSWYDPNRESTWIEHNMIYTQKIIAKECGYILKSVLNRA